MKNLALALSLILWATLTFGQNFEGKIVYNNTFKSKNPKVTDQQWALMMGSKQDYYIKGGAYKTVSNGTLMQWQLYVNSENKLYNKLSNSEAALWNDVSVNKDAVLKAEIRKGVTEIAGYKCDELVLTCKSGIQKYYFSPKIHADKNLYSKHKLGNWYDYLSKANALPLKVIISNDQFEWEESAIEVQPMILDRHFFDLPEGIKTAPSPY